jgi:hypothetical protein
MRVKTLGDFATVLDLPHKGSRMRLYSDHCGQ